MCNILNDTRFSKIKYVLNLSYSFRDSFSSFNELANALRTVSVAANQKMRARMVIGVDFTASNEWQGRRTFGKNCLHKLHTVR